MATKLEHIINTVHDAATVLVEVTAPRKKFNCASITVIFNVVTNIIGTVALLVPQIKAIAIAANVLVALNQTTEALTSNNITTLQQRKRS